MAIPDKNQLNSALISRIGDDAFNQFNSAVVAICGLGGLGSNIAISLARAGIGKLILIDFDKVDITNLNRQQYKISQIGLYKATALKENLLEINPYIFIESHVEKLSSKNYRDLLASSDIICEAFDLPEEKSNIVNFVLEHFPEKVIVAASGMAGISSANKIKTRKISDKFYLCGDGISDLSQEKSLFSSRVTICAAHQAHVVLQLLSGSVDI